MQQFLAVTLNIHIHYGIVTLVLLLRFQLSFLMLCLGSMAEDDLSASVPHPHAGDADKVLGTYPHSMAQPQSL